MELYYYQQRKQKLKEQILKTIKLLNDFNLIYLASL